VFVDTFEKFQPSVLLDTAPISGGHACLFALLNGIPVVTLPGTGISSRLGASILLNYGFPQGVATDQNSYNELAASFCNLQHIPTPPRHIQWEFMETVGNFFP
jgi:predicted O-linked N-acetylglucosamine transferase (SPINDLY family)